MASERSVTSRWDGGLRAIVRTGDFEIVVDEPESAGGTGTGPQPTELLLAAVASCFTLALAYVADRRSVELPGLSVEVTGTYDGPRFVRLVVAVSADVSSETIAPLLPAAERVCYVTNTLRRQPEITLGLVVR